MTAHPMKNKNVDTGMGVERTVAVLNGYKTVYEIDALAPVIVALLRLLEKNPEQVMAKAYDLVLNGYEIGGGSIRIHRRDLQEKIFRVLGLAEEEIKGRFGHMLEAFEYGAPPHGGIALGIDRFVAILQNEPSIREVMAFPKTGDARDLMMDAPSEVSPKQLKEAHINIIHES